MLLIKSENKERTHKTLLYSQSFTCHVYKEGSIKEHKYEYKTLTESFLQTICIHYTSHESNILNH